MKMPKNHFLYQHGLLSQNSSDITVEKSQIVMINIDAIRYHFCESVEINQCEAGG